MPLRRTASSANRPRVAGPVRRPALAAAAALAVALTACSSPPSRFHDLALHPRAAGPHVATASRGFAHSAELDVVSGATTLTVTAANLGGTLLRAATPANSNVRPDLVTGTNGTAQLYLDATGQGGPAAVEVQLNSAVTWRLLFAGGTSQTSVSLSNATLASTDFAAGSNLVSMMLPRPHGTVTIEVAGGASQVSLILPPHVPAQLRLDGGASTATLLGQTHTGIAGGTVLTSPGWAQATARYLIDATSGVSAIAVSSN
jgi:hypothetical protein